jgi:hypothetical protein
MEDIGMKSDWIIPTLACAVFPVMIPLALLLVITVSVSAATKTIPSEELGG